MRASGFELMQLQADREAVFCAPGVVHYTSNALCPSRFILNLAMSLVLLITVAGRSAEIGFTPT
eukprot:scaffold299613_cov24-Tisochrysis_lutea.AAC.1